MITGFYLHTGWEFEHPFAVRSWSREDFSGWFTLMKELGMDVLMFWPLFEAMPAPLSEADRQVILGWKEILADAKSRDLATWVVQTANCTTPPEIAEKPFKERHFYHIRLDVRLDDPQVRDAYFAHRANLMGALDNADGYVTIDGDPGSYPGAKPEQFLEVFQHDRAILDAMGRSDAQLIPWIWAGWGCHRNSQGYWDEAIAPLTTPVLDMLKAKMPAPWTLLPGRNLREGFGSGRTNFALTENAGLVENSVLFCYDIIELEPVAPAVFLQFDDIRRVLREEAPLLQKARGVMGNAQQPIMALPNLFFFARAAREPEYLTRSDEEILRDLATFLGGDNEILVPAWQSGYLPLGALSADLPARLRASRLTSHIAEGLPGGPQKYLDILAIWVETRLAVLRVCSQPPETPTHAVAALIEIVQSLVSWWNVHRYVFSGEMGNGFRVDWTHPLLLVPIQEWCADLPGDRDLLKRQAVHELSQSNFLTPSQAHLALDGLLPKAAHQ